MASFDPNKAKSILPVDWTSLGSSAKPFFQSASGSLPDRYSVTILSQYSTTGGPELDSRLAESITPALDKVLDFYEKQPEDSTRDNFRVEDYYISERPSAKIKVLISVPCNIIDNLPDQEYSIDYNTAKPPTKEISLNTSDLSLNLDIAATFLEKYKGEIDQFYGRVYDIDLDDEITKLKGFLPALTTFVQANNIVYSSANSDLITLYANDDYKVLVAKVNQGSGYVELTKGYNNFLTDSSVNHDRTIFLLTKLDQIADVYLKNQSISWSEFFKEYIFRPPTIDFSKPPPQSHVLSEEEDEKIKQEQRQLAVTKEQITLFNGYMNNEEVRESYLKKMNEASQFTGDTVLANLDQLSSLMKDMDSLYDSLLNKVGIDGLLDSAMQCLDYQQLGLTGISTDILDTLTQATATVQGAFNPPTMEFPDNFPIVDFMKDTIEKMLVGILESMFNTLVSMIIEIIKSLFDFCNECAVESDAQGNKTFSELRFGQASFGGIVKSAFGLGFANPESILLGSFYSSLDDGSGGNIELFAQSVLKNSIKNKDQLLVMEAQKVYAEYQDGKLPQDQRVILEDKVEKLFKDPARVARPDDQGEIQASTWARFGLVAMPTNSLFYNLDENTLFESTEVTPARIFLVLRNESPWESKTFKNAAQQLTEYLELTSTVLNPGELGNAMLGCNVGGEAKEAMRNALPDFPDIYSILAGTTDEETDDNISRCWLGVGNLLPETVIVEQITSIVNNVPEKYRCLCEADDTALREQLLAKKDPQMSPEQRREQVQKSKDRKKQRLKDLASLMGKGNALEGLLPPLVCSGSFDESGNPIIVPGVLSSTHPVTQMMVKGTLDTIYDPLHTTFSRDLSGLIPAMSQRPIVKKEVKRTVIANVNDTDVRVFNPEFLDMIGKGLVTYGSLPYGSKIPQSAAPVTESDGSLPEGEPILYNWFLGSIGFDDYKNFAGAGMWEEGQTRPTPEQEYDWEQVNRAATASAGQSIIGGRRMGDYVKHPELGKNYAGETLTMDAYAKTFGASPIPVETYDFGELNFAPGLKTSYNQMCSPEAGIFKISNQPTSTKYEFDLPNPTKDIGIDFNNIAAQMGTVKGEILSSFGSRETRTQKSDEEMMSNMETQMALLGGSSFDIVYDVKHDDGTNNIQQDKFSLDMLISPPQPLLGRSGASPDALAEKNLGGPIATSPINPKAIEILNWKNLEVAKGTNQSVQPQEGYFYDFAKYSWENGNTIYRNGEAVQKVSPRQTPASLKGILNTTDPANYPAEFIDYLYSKDTYSNQFKDLLCSMTNQIAQSPYINLQPDDQGRGLLNVKLSPAKVVGQGPLCYRTLLDVDLIKQRVLEEYEYVKCFREAFDLPPGTDSTGLLGNKDSAFEVSNRSGAVLLTVRLYAVEFLLKSVYTFHYFVINDASQVDDTSVYYLYHQIHDALKNRSIGTTYYSEFQKETIGLYNRNVESNPLSMENKDSEGNYPDFRVALEFFIRNQIASVSRRLAKHVKLKGDGSIDSILVDEWIPTVEPVKAPNEIRFAELVEDQAGIETWKNKTLGNYKTVAGIPTISDEIISAISPDGTLSEKRINLIRGGSGAKGGVWGMLYQKASGYFFREYFAPDIKNEEARNLLRPFTKASELKTKARDAANSLWTPTAGTVTSPAQSSRVPGTVNPNVNAFREGILLGWSASEQPFAKDAGILNNACNYESEGLVGKYGFPFKRAIIDSPIAVGKELPTPIGENETILSGSFPFGVSQAEIEGMIGDGDSIPGGLIRFIEAATNWTMGPKGQQSGINRDLPPNYLRYEKLGDTRTPNGEYVIYERTNRPWWYNGPNFYPNGAITHSDDRVVTKRVNYLRSYNMIGPGSLLWAMSRYDGRKQLPGNSNRWANGVGVFGLVNHLLMYQDSALFWPNEYKSGTSATARGQDYGSTIITNAISQRPGRTETQIPFLIDWHNYVLGKGTEQDYTLGTNSEITKNVESAIYHCDENIIPYISLLDLDVRTIIKTLEWERQQYIDFKHDFENQDWATTNEEPHSFCLKVLKKGTLGARSAPELETLSRNAIEAFRTQLPTNVGHYDNIIAKYGDWIAEMVEIRNRFTLAEEQRQCMAEPARELLANGRMPRNEMLVPPTFDLENGGVILEPYIRVEDHEPDPNIQDNIDFVKNRGVDAVGNIDLNVTQNVQALEQNMLKGVVNIDLWDQYMKKRFEGSIPTQKLPADELVATTINQEDCGDTLPNRQTDFNTLTQDPPIVQPSDPQLRDFFKSVYFGVRLSHVSSLPDGFENSATSQGFGTPRNDIARINAAKEKTYELIEKTPDGKVRRIYVTPLTAVEKETNMFTKISDMNLAQGYSVENDVAEILNKCGAQRETPDDAKKVGYFRYMFGKANEDMAGDTIPLSSPRDDLQQQLIRTDEYSFLFKYVFPVNRMLSLTNIYSAMYLESLPDIKNMFAPTKENLMYIFLNSLRSGQYADACQTGNKDLLDAFANGINPPWAAFLALVLKFPLKIFKSFMEQSDINIAISKNIQRVIQTLNGIIADAQRQANAVKAQAEAFAASAERIANLEITEQGCGFGIHSPEATQKPPDNWFDPVDATFLYEPETWMIGLSLMPATIFAPWLWGPPITLPHGLAYWALDDSRVNWLDAYVDDWISQLQNDKDNLEVEVLTEECDIDHELEFGTTPAQLKKLLKTSNKQITAGSSPPEGISAGNTGDTNGSGNQSGGY